MHGFLPHRSANFAQVVATTASTNLKLVSTHDLRDETSLLATLHQHSFTESRPEPDLVLRYAE